MAACLAREAAPRIFAMEIGWAAAQLLVMVTKIMQTCPGFSFRKASVAAKSRLPLKLFYLPIRSRGKASVRPI